LAGAGEGEVSQRGHQQADGRQGDGQHRQRKQHCVGRVIPDAVFGEDGQRIEVELEQRGHAVIEQTHQELEQAGDGQPGRQHRQDDTPRRAGV
jgi:hypothetical protein